MRPVLSAEQIRAFDAHAIEAGVSGSILMENAGRGAAHLIGLKLRPRALGEAPRTGSSVVGSCVRCADEKSLFGAKVLILAGGGNNGGDGFVVARHLAARAAEVTVLLAVPPEQLKGDARIAFDAMEAVGVRALALFDVPFSDYIEQASFIVDALLGTGADRPVEGALREAIECINASSAYVVALDLPSGLHATRGSILGVAVVADHTVTFAHLKAGLLTTRGHAHCGNVTMSHIGVPSALPQQMNPRAWLLEESDARARLPKRGPTVHKGKAGRVVAVAGSSGTLGAARLSAHAALRGGAGLVTICSESEAISKLETDVAEVMTFAFHPSSPEGVRALLEGADALIVGPGLGQSATAHQLIELAFLARRPTVVDADALRYVAGPGRTLWHQQGPFPWAVMTPHAAEAAALLDITVAEVEDDRFGAAEGIAQRYGCTVLLKGSRPILCTEGRAPVVSAFGSPALATGGSGDVFCGILAAQLVGVSKEAELFDRLMVAVALQGQAAEAWSRENGERGMLASDVADRVPQIIRSWTSV